MGDLSEAFSIAFHLLASFDRELFEIIALSLKVSLIAVAISCFLGFLMGAALCVYRFRGKQIIVIVINALMGLPPVVVGLCVYLMLSRSGPLACLGCFIRRLP